MAKELYPFQKIGAKFAASRPHSGNADAMGLGKTAQAIETINLTRPGSVLIICPATIKINWQRELEEWLTHSLAPGIVDGDAWVDEAITIINYDILERHIAKIHAKTWDMIIVDEAHYIKNLEAYRTAAVLGLPAGRKMWLTGTPILNRPVELMPLLYYIEAINEASFTKFQNRYCNAQLRNRGGGRGKYWDYRGSSNLEELAEKFSPWIIRRTKEDVLPELPPKRRQIIELGKGSSNGVLGEWLHMFKKADEEANTLEERRRALRRFNAEFALEFGEMSSTRREDAMSKLPAVISFLRDAVEGSGKVVCFAHHRDFIAEIRKAFSKTSVAVIGGMGTEAKQAAVDRFQSDSGVNLFIGNIKAAGIGVDGLQKVCSHVVFAELDWTPGLVEQAEDRCHRIGQKDSLLVQHLVADGTLDVIMAKMLVSKQYVIDKIQGEKS